MLNPLTSGPSSPPHTLRPSSPLLAPCPTRPHLSRAHYSTSHQTSKPFPSQSSDPSSPLSLLTRELHHHRRLRHPHILALFELIATESSIYLVSELCSGGELFDYLVEKGRLSLDETRRIFGQLVLGVNHLHRSGVVHRDLKLENILLDERVNVKIADLGFGREFEKGRWMETWVGTLGYTAPEVVGAKRYLGEGECQAQAGGGRGG